MTGDAVADSQAARQMPIVLEQVIELARRL